MDFRKKRARRRARHASLASVVGGATWRLMRGHGTKVGGVSGTKYSLTRWKRIFSD